MKKLILFCILYFLLPIWVYSQQMSDDQLRTVFIFKFTEGIKWENEDNLQTFKIGAFDCSKEMYKGLKVLEEKKVKGVKPIKVVSFSKISDIKGVQMVFVPIEHLADIEEVFKQIKGSNILLVSDQATNKKKVMINFDKPANNRIKFEINKANMINEKLTITGDKLILLGGTEIDVAKLYQDSQDALADEKEKVKKQRTEIDEQKRRIDDQQKKIDVQKAEIEIQKSSIEKQKAEIEQQKLLISAQEKKVKELADNIAVQQRILQAKIDTMKLKEREIVAKEDTIRAKRVEMKRQDDILKSKLSEIEKSEQKISEQNSVLLRQKATIAFQKNIMYFFITFILLILSLVFFVYRSYKIKKQANILLQNKNREINEQKQEIEAQAEELAAQAEELSVQAETLGITNESLEREKEYTTSSIRYALTIQQAMLPQKATVDKVFNSFIVFRPKDIVSGDFYWWSHLPEENCTLVAVMDCTGHGVPGAFMSMIGNHLLNEIVNNKNILQPSKIMDMMNKGIKKALKQDTTTNDDGMDAILCKIDKSENGNVKITFCGAKRPLYYSHEDKINVMKGDIKTIGGRYYEDIEFTDKEVVVSVDDKIYLMSDGLADQADNQRNRFKNAHLMELLEQNILLSMEEQGKIVEKELDKHKGKERQRDDITLWGIQIPA